jgi:hypothetical protein
MICPSCMVSDNSAVIDSRLTAGGRTIRRRRKCLGCGTRWTTWELSEADSDKIVPLASIAERLMRDIVTTVRKARKNKRMSAHTLRAYLGLKGTSRGVVAKPPIRRRKLIAAQVVESAHDAPKRDRPADQDGERA